MARPLRIEYEGAFYHVTARGNERKRIFFGKGILVDRDAYLLELSRYLHLNPVRAKIVDSPEDYRQSSYLTYVKGKKDAMVTTDLLLGMACEDGRIARRAYREYVEAGMAEGVRNPFADVYGGVILGGREFIKQALSKVKEGVLDKAEIAQRRELHKLRSEDVIDALCSHFGVHADSLGEWGTALRDMAIYLLKRHTSVMNRQIGELFQGLTYSGVSKANHRFSLRMSEDRNLRKTVEKIARSMSNVKA